MMGGVGGARFVWPPEAPALKRIRWQHNRFSILPIVNRLEIGIHSASVQFSDGAEDRCTVVAIALQTCNQI